MQYGYYPKLLKVYKSILPWLNNKNTKYQVKIFENTCAYIPTDYTTTASILTENTVTAYVPSANPFTTSVPSINPVT